MNLKELMAEYESNEAAIESAMKRRLDLEIAMSARIGSTVDIVFMGGRVPFISVAEPPEGSEATSVSGSKPFISYETTIDGVEVKCFKDVEP